MCICVDVFVHAVQLNIPNKEISDGVFDDPFDLRSVPVKHEVHLK